MINNLRQLFLEHVGQTSDSPMLLEVERAEGIYLYGPVGSADDGRAAGASSSADGGRMAGANRSADGGRAAGANSSADGGRAAGANSSADGGRTGKYAGRRRWIDLISGVSVSNVGHGNKYVTDAVCAQARDYTHLMVYGEAVQSPQVRYAEKVASMLPDPLDTVYFVNSGSEAVEGALKLAKRYTGRTELCYFHGAYHGSTQGSLSVMGGEEYRNSYRPLLPDTRMLEFDDMACLRDITPRTAGVIIEPIQGEGGIKPASVEFLKALRARCSEVGAMLIFDEIQTGTFRTGNFYAFMDYGVVPDVLCTAKSFGGGMPLGAFISSNEVMSCLKTNPALGHITTFGGHPVCCAAGMAALEYILDNDLAAGVEEKGALYEKIVREHPAVKGIRRRGLLLAVEFKDFETTKGIVLDAIEAGLVTEWFLFHETAMRIAPPLTITPDEIEESCRILVSVMDRYR